MLVSNLVFCESMPSFSLQRANLLLLRQQGLRCRANESCFGCQAALDPSRRDSILRSLVALLLVSGWRYPYTCHDLLLFQGESSYLCSITLIMIGITEAMAD